MTNNIEPDPGGPYCVECGEDDKRKLVFEGLYPNGTYWRCRTCRHEFMHKERDETEHPT